MPLWKDFSSERVPEYQKLLNILPNIDKMNFSVEDEKTLRNNLRGTMLKGSTFRNEVNALTNLVCLYHSRNYATDRVVVMSPAVLSKYLTHHQMLHEEGCCEWLENLRDDVAFVTEGGEKPLFYVLIYATTELREGFLAVYHVKTKQFFVLDSKEEDRDDFEHTKAVVALGHLLFLVAGEDVPFVTEEELGPHLIFDERTYEMTISETVMTMKINFGVDSHFLWPINSLFANMIPVFAL